MKIKACRRRGVSSRVWNSKRSTMWMAYSAQSWPVAVDVQTAVQRLIAEFEDYAFEAEHDAVYDIAADEQFLHKLAEKYRNGRRSCEEFLEKKITYEEWKAKLISYGLEEFVEEVEQFKNRGQ